ncbi:MAG: class I SAM-dependent methyltransferase [Anaerolineae bacterium]|nr:class I SAM-dependent methyltransferase [Anaerolineae bacterium]
MPDCHKIYAARAIRYDRLVSCEDYQGNISRAVQSLAALDGANVIEPGAGTGRLTGLLAPWVRSICAFDLSPHMLGVAQNKLSQSGLRNWQLAVADHRHLPLPNACADLVVSGWSVCYLAVDYPQSWPDELERGLAEMRRVLRPGGSILLLETLGTGFETPHAPEPLREYFVFLEARGFESTWIRTDYRFASLDEAEALARFFFGDQLAQQVVEQNWIVLPECTGLWRLTV